MTLSLGYVIYYVADVPATIAHYQAAFGLDLAFMHDSQAYAELQTGATKLAFVSETAAPEFGFTITQNRPTANPAGVEVAFVTDDVQSAYDHAIANGAHPQTPPAQKPWGQTVAYVRDINGCLVELCTPMSMAPPA